MAKQRRPDAPGPDREPPAPRPVAEAVEQDLADALALGNQAATHRLVGARTAAETEVRALAERVATALRIPPRDAGHTARLVDLVERSRLPDDRRTLIAMRLESDQAVADQVAAAVDRWLGADDPAVRSAWIAAFEAAADRASGAGGPPARWLAGEVAAVTGAGAPAAEGLIAALSAVVAFAWDEDEEEAPPGDYAAEESGF